MPRARAAGFLMIEIIKWVLERTKAVLISVGVPENLSTDFVAKVLASLVSALILAAITFLIKKIVLAPLGRLFRRSRAADSPEEIKLQREYLNWLLDKLKKVGQQWHETPIETVIPSVPLEARKRRLPLRLRASRWAKTMFRRARLFRYNPLDYVKVPFLADLDLSVRAGFGRRMKIRDLAKELRKYTKIVVLGDPGSGKSVCLRQLGYDLAERELLGHACPALLPVFVDMGAYDAWEDRNTREPAPLLGFLQEHLRSDLSLRQAPTTHSLLYLADNLESLLKQGRVVCLFDALDEMPQDSYQERYRAIREFMQYWEKYGNRFVYSCRTLDYDQSFKVDEVIIEPFDRRRIRAFLRRHVPENWQPLYQRIIEDEWLEELVGNPFFLQALAFINKPDGEAAVAQAPRIPETRAKLIRAFAEKLLRREAEQKQTERLGSIVGGLETLRKFLSELAFAIQSRREGGTSVATRELQDVWERYPEWEALLLIATRARILGKRGIEAEPDASAPPVRFRPPERVEFVHHRVEEFFAADQLTRSLESGWAVESHLEDIWWQETVILAIGALDDPRPLVLRLLAQRPDTTEWVRDAVALAEAAVPGLVDEGGSR